MSVLIPVGRKSSKEDPRESRERQERAFAMYAQTHPDDILLPMVWEGGVSAGKIPWTERGLGLVLKRIESGEADGVLFEETSRATREDMLATAEMWREFDRLSLVLVCIAEGIDTRTGDQELNFGIRALLAREQWKQYARRVKSAKKNAVERGCHLSGHTAAGYVRTRVDGRGGPLALNPEIAPFVTRAFEMRARGASIEEIARYLETNCPSERWSSTKVSAMLKRRVYLGEASGSSKGETWVVPNAHPALTDEETFRVVQGTFRTADPRSNRGEKNILAGSIRCDNCGHAADRSIVNRVYEVYRCRNRECSEQFSISAPKLDALVWERTLAQLRAEVEEGRFEVESSERSNRVAEIHAKLSPLYEARDLFRDPRYAASIGRDAALAGAEETAEEIRVLERELADVNRVVSGDGPTAREILERFEEGDLSPEQIRTAISRTFDSVIVARAPRGTAIEDRVALHLVGDGTAPARPARGRRTRNHSQEEGGVLAA